jgi:NAD(P)-dependent dehydrogenase (short-subunit alcohol dehydrogenase family)
MFSVRGKVVIITGASAGIGLGTAELFAEAGARLVLVARRGALLEQVCTRLRGSGAQVVGVSGDVAEPDTIARAVAAATGQFGRIDVVFNNAGIMPHGDLLSFGQETWDEVMAVNVRAMFLMAKAVIPQMLAQGGGSIINNSSVMATLTEPGYDAYTTSKAVIIGLTKSLAVTYAEQNIRVNAICPGWVDTPLNAQLAEEMGGMDKLYPIIKKQQPSGRMATTREVGYVVLFLASDEASAVTGSIVAVDGAASAAI